MENNHELVNLYNEMKEWYDHFVNLCNDDDDNVLWQDRRHAKWAMAHIGAIIQDCCPKQANNCHGDFLVAEDRIA